MTYFDDTVINCTYVEDANKYIAYLPTGLYRIQNTQIKINTSCGERYVNYEVDDVNDICRLNVSTVIAGYNYVDGNTYISVDEYNDRIKDLYLKYQHAKQNYSTSDILYIECLYNYTKENEKYIPVYKEVINKTPVVFAILPVKTKICDGYGISMFASHDEKKREMYKYLRLSATVDIAENIFKELGFTCVEDVNYEYTEDKKVYCISSKKSSGIRYLTAFGKYIFGKEYENMVDNYIYKKSELIELYEYDKKNIRDIIIKYYNIKYNNVNVKSDLIKDIRSDLENISTKLTNLNVCKNSSREKNRLGEIILKSIKKIDNILVNN